MLSAHLTTPRWALLLTTLAFACTDVPEATAPMSRRTSALAVKASNAPVNLDSLSRQLRQRGVRKYSVLEDSLLWQFIAGGDSIGILGLKEPGADRGVSPEGRSLVSAAAINAAFTAIERTPGVTVLNRDMVLPKARIRFDSEETMRRVRRFAFADYLEPDRMYDFRVMSSGCGMEAYTNGYSTLPEGDVVPATYPWMFIDRAWGMANGQGVKVGLVDTGADELQPELNQRFATGAVTNRTIERHGEQTNPCSHGTRLAGVIAAPRNGLNVVGIAYGASLYSADFGESTVSWNAWNVENAIRVAGEAGSKVMNMAFGTGIAYNNIDAEINRWFGMGVTLVGAAGTWEPCYIANSNNVLWPAEKEEVIAVSPAYYDGSRPCHAAYGPSLDLVAYEGNPTTGNGNVGDALVAVGKSSNASAIVSGVAAMIHQRFPGITPIDLKFRLIHASECLRPNMPGSWHRMVNAEAALGGICLRSAYPVNGPTQVDFWPGDPDVKSVTLEVNTAEVTGGAGQVTFHFLHPASAASNTITFNLDRPPPGQSYVYNPGLYIRQSGSTAPPLALYRSITVTDNSDFCGVGCLRAPSDPPVRKRPSRLR